MTSTSSMKNIGMIHTFKFIIPFMVRKSLPLYTGSYWHSSWNDLLHIIIFLVRISNLFTNLINVRGFLNESLTGFICATSRNLSAIRRNLCIHFQDCTIVYHIRYLSQGSRRDRHGPWLTVGSVVSPSETGILWPLKWAACHKLTTSLILTKYENHSLCRVSLFSHHGRV